MSEHESMIPEELAELVQYLVLQLSIPLHIPAQQAININMFLLFGCQCLNSIMSKLNQNWENINSSHYHSDQSQLDTEKWLQLIAMIEDSFLQENSKRVSDGQNIDINDIVEAFGILCHGCEAIRQSSDKVLNGPKRKQKNQKTKDKTSQQKNKKATKNKMKGEQPILGSELQKDILQTVAKTLKNNKKKEHPKYRAAIRDKQANQVVQKAKRTFQYALKDHQKENRIARNNQLKRQINNGIEGATQFDQVDNAYMKYIQNKHKKLNEQIDSQQLKYYVELRDKKIAYIRHIHKLIEKLERERKIDQEKQQKQQHRQYKKQLQMKLQQVDNIFSQNIEQLHQKYNQKRKAKVTQHVEEKKVCRELEAKVKKQKQQEMEDMKNLWDFETRQLELITGDEQKMKKKLIDIYRRNRV